MIDFISNYLLTPYVQAVLFFLLIGLFFLQHRRTTMLSMGLSWLRTIVLVLLFLYFAWNWASEIPASLRAASVMGMLVINLSMLYNLLLGNLEEKYRQSLQAYGQDPKNKALREKVWSTGKTFLRVRYFFDGLLSGHAPSAFLHGLVNHQIPSDIQAALAKHGVASELVSHQTMLTFLAAQLDQSTLLTGELKENIAQTLKQFAEHAWIQEQVDAFLRLALTDPEKLSKKGEAT